MQFHKKTEINGHELLFDQLQLCGPEVPTVRGILTERLSAQPLSGLLQLPEAGACCLSAGLSLPPPSTPPTPPAASRAAVHAVPARRTACLGGDVPSGSRFTPVRASDHPRPGAESSLRIGDTKPASASVLRANASQPKHFVPHKHP